MALRSFIRNRKMTLISISVVLAMTVFLLAFANSIRLNKLSLDDAYDNLEVTAHIRGATTQADPYLEEARYQAIIDSGFVLEHSAMIRFQQGGSTTLFGVTGSDASAMLVEALQYTDWLEGYDKTALQSVEAVCLAPVSSGLELGEERTFHLQERANTVNLKVVGLYELETGSSSSSYFCSRDWLVNACCELEIPVRYNALEMRLGNIDSILENISSITVASNENTFDNRALNDVESDVLEIAEDMMIDEYGNEYYEYGIRTKTYSDMTVRIDETFYIFADCIDWVELDESLTHAASVTKMAARFGVATPMALLIFATLVTTYNALENLQEKIGVGLYQGTAITERNGFAKLNGSTSFVPTAISATESIIERIGATIDENNVIQSVEFVGNPDVLYAPSEYEFDVSVILDDVHDLMSN